MATASKLPVDTTATATDMAESMFGNGITILSALYTGADTASGIYSNGDDTAPDLTPSDTGVILSTGNATDVTNASGEVNTSDSTTTEHGTAGDDGLNEISGQTTFDAAIFEATFIPDGSTLTMQVVFSSEEYLEYVDSGFNDAVGIWVNGSKAKLTVGSGDISIDNINNTTNENLYIDNPDTDDVYNTEMDGFTVTLTLKADVRPGETNSIKIGIADGGDANFDSNLLIAGDSVQTALVAGDDEIEVELGSEASVNLLENDESTFGSELRITHINGNPVMEGDKVALPSGELIELTANGFILAEANDIAEDNVFSYTVADNDGNTDVGFVTITTTPCFTLGTMIRTPTGDQPVETLKPGDLVETLDNGPRPLLWVGRSQRRGTGDDAPIEFAPGVLGATSKTALSPLHHVLVKGHDAMLISGSYEVLVKAKHLENAGSIRRRDMRGSLSYFHLLFDRHEIIFGDGMPSESYQPGKQTVASFDPALTADLERVVRQHGLATMVSARPILKRHEAKFLQPLVVKSAEPEPA